VMAIVGGAIVPPLMGWLADRHGPRDSYLILTVCFAVVGAFALYARHFQLRRQIPTGSPREARPPK
jgi:MFS transporter, FHS family, L-fucose permease